MTSAKTALEAQIYVALAAGVANAAVYQDVPQNQPPPLVAIGEMRAVPIGAKDDPDRRITVSILSMVSAEERAPLLAIINDIESAIDGSRFAADGWRFAGTFEESEATMDDDGENYIGVSQFSFLAFKD